MSDKLYVLPGVIPAPPAPPVGSVEDPLQNALERIADALERIVASVEVKSHG